jgi:hypothetical protein
MHRLKAQQAAMMLSSELEVLQALEALQIHCS